MYKLSFKKIADSYSGVVGWFNVGGKEKVVADKAIPGNTVSKSKSN